MTTKRHRVTASVGGWKSVPFPFGVFKVNAERLRLRSKHWSWWSRVLMSTHVCRGLRARDISNLVTKRVLEMVAMSASNWASLNAPEVLEQLEPDPDQLVLGKPPLSQCTG
jgi:hypothetical protein